MRIRFIILFVIFKNVNIVLYIIIVGNKFILVGKNERCV